MFAGLHLADGTQLEIDATPLAHGGEATLHAILGPQHLTSRIAKLYRNDSKLSERRRKVEYLIANRPHGCSTLDHSSVIWAEATLFRAGHFLGFTMFRARGQPLELLCHASRTFPAISEWAKMDWSAPEGLTSRIRLCFNIATALYQIHRSNRYVLVDMKPENIIVQSNALVSLIDLDSIAVVDQGTVLFPPPVATPEYTPPEHAGACGPTVGNLTDTWDRFSLAVVLYRVLCGIHPFTGTCSTPYDGCSSYTDKISKGLFPHSPKARRHFAVIPALHNRFDALRPAIRSLFLRCFVDGAEDPSLRPAAGEWCEVLAPRRRLTISYPLPSTFLTPREVVTPCIPTLPSVAIDVPRSSTAVRTRSMREMILRLLSARERALWAEVDQRQAEHNAVITQLSSLKQKSDSANEDRQLFCREAIQSATASRKSCMAQQAVIIGRADDEFSRLVSAEGDALESAHKECDKALEHIADQELKDGLADWRRDSPGLANDLDDANHRLARARAILATELSKAQLAYRDRRARAEVALATAERDYQQRHQAMLQSLSSETAALERELREDGASRRQRAVHALVVEELARQTISSAATAIFTDRNATPSALVAALRDAGIRTAADFVGARDDGAILMPDGRWRKLSGIGAYRASCLCRWRSARERESRSRVNNAEVSRREALLEVHVRRSLDSSRAKLAAISSSELTQRDLALQPFREALARVESERARDEAIIRQRHSAEVDRLVSLATTLTARAREVAVSLERQHVSRKGERSERRHRIKEQFTLRTGSTKQQYTERRDALVESTRGLLEDCLRSANESARRVQKALDDAVSVARDDCHRYADERVRLIALVAESQSRLNSALRRARESYGTAAPLGAAIALMIVLVYIGYGARYAPAHRDRLPTQHTPATTGPLTYPQATAGAVRAPPAITASSPRDHHSFSLPAKASDNKWDDLLVALDSGAQGTSAADNHSIASGDIRLLAYFRDSSGQAHPLDGLGTLQLRSRDATLGLSTNMEMPLFLTNIPTGSYSLCLSLESCRSSATCEVKVASCATSDVAIVLSPRPWRVRFVPASSNQALEVYDSSGFVGTTDIPYDFPPHESCDLTIRAIGWRDHRVTLRCGGPGITLQYPLAMERTEAQFCVTVMASNGRPPNSGWLSMNGGPPLQVEFPYESPKFCFLDPVTLSLSIDGYRVLKSTRQIDLNDGVVTNVVFTVTPKSWITRLFDPAADHGDGR